MTTTTTSVIKKLLVLFLVFAGLHYTQSFLMPLSIGAVMATLVLPLSKWLEKKKVPRALSVLLCVLSLLFGLSMVASMLGWQISELINDIALIKERAINTVNRIQEFIFNQFGITLEKQSQILKEEQPSVSGIMQTVAGSLASVFTNFILTLVYIFGLLYYRDHINQFLLKLAPPAQRKDLEAVITSITRVSQQYLVGLSKMIICLWIMYGIGFSIIGVENALFFAVLCGLLEIIPFIGNITGTTITVIVAAVHGAGIPMLAGIVIVYGTVQLIQGWILEPLILGPQVKINPLFTIIALVIGELVWGIAGIFLAIPITAMFKIVCDNIESLKPYGFLIGETATDKAEPGFVKKIKTWYETKKTK